MEQAVEEVTLEDLKRYDELLTEISEAGTFKKLQKGYETGTARFTLEDLAGIIPLALARAKEGKWPSWKLLARNYGVPKGTERRRPITFYARKLTDELMGANRKRPTVLIRALLRDMVPHQRNAGRKQYEDLVEFEDGINEDTFLAMFERNVERELQALGEFNENE